MAITLTVCDESNLGERRPTVTLHLPEPTITARELIRARVFEEVKAYNEGLGDCFDGLIQPTSQERALNGDKAGKLANRRKVDWHEQARVALEAFERNGFLLLVDDHQIDSLAAEIRLRPETQVVFLKLMPLVGG
ncbi:MAG TPA: hypothetical protein VLE27_10770 [Thermoanaerobaculia bacterium]|nr:hypothetical protein [Thermoanaerobaculia bacterium]